MHQVEKIQSYFRVKPEKPNLQEIYLPIPDYEDYIILFNDEMTQSHKYDYMADVVEYLRDVNPNLNFVQVTNVANPDKISNAYLVEGISHNQLFFLVKNSIAVICTDTFTPEICGIYDKPMVCLSGNRFASNANPYFFNPEKHVSICPVDQPSFFAIEKSKAINEIMPEDVSRHLLEILELKDTTPSIKTEFVGSLYRKYTIDYIPDFEISHSNSINYPVNVRLDIECNLENTLKSARFNPIQSIVCNSEFDIGLLEEVRSSIGSVRFEVGLDSDLTFVRNLNQLGCNVILHTKDKENINKIRLKFIDWIVTLTEDKQKPIELDPNKKYYYKSTKLTLSNNKKYISLAAKNKDIETNEVVDCSDFWQESDHFMIYSVDK
jgi:hypothetical protein